MQKMILLTASLFLISCGKGTHFPLAYIYVVDVQHQVCAQKMVESRNPIKFKHVADLPLAYCDGGVLIAYNDWLGFKKWLERLMDRVKEKLGLDVNNDKQIQEFLN